MGNCLVTKLKGTVNNNNLHKLGYIDVPVAYLRSVRATATPVYVYAEGGDGLIDGQTSITIPSWTNKVATGTTGKFYIEKYSNCEVGFNTSQDVNLDGIIDIEQFNDYVNDIYMYYIHLSEGEFSEYNGNLSFQNGNPIGTVYDIAKYTKLKGITTAFCLNNWDWNVCVVAKGMPNLERLARGGNGAYADWDRPSSYPVLTLTGAGNAPDPLRGAAADAYLNNMAQCQIGTMYFYIHLASRTHASDTAVSTLQGMGYTVVVDSIVE